MKTYISPRYLNRTARQNTQIYDNYDTDIDNYTICIQFFIYFHHVAYIDLCRFLTCLDKLYTGAMSSFRVIGFLLH